MAERKSLTDTLRATSLALALIRKVIAENGHLEALTDIDTLVAVTLAETNQRLAAASH